MRASALDVLKDTADEPPADRLMGLAQSDTEPAVRAPTLALLAEWAGDGAGETLRAALTDPVPKVREVASELLSIPPRCGTRRPNP